MSIKDELDFNFLKMPDRVMGSNGSGRCLIVEACKWIVSGWVSTVQWFNVGVEELYLRRAVDAGHINDLDTRARTSLSNCCNA